MFNKIKNIFEKNELPDINKKSNDVFMINRFLSMTPESFFESQKSNEFNGKIPSWASELLLYYTVEKQHAPRISYIKKKASKVDKKLLKLVCDSFHCSNNQGEEVIEIFKLKKINIKNIFGCLK